MMTIIFKEAILDDIPRLVVLAQKTYSKAFGYSLSEEELAQTLEENKSEKYFTKMISDNGNTYILATRDDQIIGYVGLRDPDRGFEGRQPTDQDQSLDGIYVDYDFHRQGIGRQLMDQAFSHPRFQKAENVYLFVWDENKPAYNFYLNYGFENVGVKEIKVSGTVIGYDQVLMKRVSE